MTVGSPTAEGLSTRSPCGSGPSEPAARPEWDEQRPGVDPGRYTCGSGPSEPAARPEGATTHHIHEVNI